MNFKLSALAAITVAAVASATTTTVTAYDVAELDAIMADAKSHLFQYMLLVMSGKLSMSDLPAGVVDVAMDAIDNKDYSSLLTEVDFDGVNSMVTALPWYSTRLLPQINSIYSKEQATATLL